MRIALDAKRAFLNRTGLGNYSRAVIRGLLKFSSENEYFACSPKVSDLLPLDAGLTVIQPETVFAKLLPGIWRSRSVIGQLKAHDVQLYHGLSNELPFGIGASGIRSVVTVHDLIFLRHPQFYSAIDRWIYGRKVNYACKAAGRIIAISKQTKGDICELLHVDGSKIDVVYQSCHPRFYAKASDHEKEAVIEKYNLPSDFILSVGTIEERKNHQQIIRALAVLNDPDLHLVIAGRKTDYFNRLQELVGRMELDSNVHFRHEMADEDLPALYQQAKLFVYTSMYEGFGIPVLEALASGVPVIAGRGGCLEEVGGSRSLYADPLDARELTEAMQRVLNNDELAGEMIREGRKHAEKFSTENMVQGTLDSYERAKFR